MTFTQQRQRRRVQTFTEDLGNSIGLDLILIPGGTFQMGQTDGETAELLRLVGEKDYQDYYARELPQHSVTVPPFFMGRYPVTQAQWRTVATLPQVNRTLKPNPSRFNGDNCPVERVSWFDAVEFCDRLSAFTGRTYRLPTEAKWEYACRAGTTTSFHTGETLTTDLANYNGNSTYGRGANGVYRKQTTAVGSFPPNAFGLSDMHGNVLEWCLDQWHRNYEGAPADGSAWVKGGDNSTYVLCGGSWSRDPQNCRSAYRGWYYPVNDSNLIGFRVVCVLPGTL